ncbi:substrate-binding periplasmic protein [Pseudodesulfovibrio karagichevae]|uniref:Substrate-binding periplasmic protein n=1 Tax=Pseudodesulfovibrio karagichevae TaxID=3239305 RepID=A0ABV4K538_9BACT
MTPYALSFWLALALCVVSSAYAESLVVASDEWCPYNCGSGDEREGYAVDVLRAIFEPAGIAVDYRIMGWERAVEEARRGHVEAVIGATTDEAVGFVFPDEPIGVDFFAFYVRAGDPWRYVAPDSLRGKSLGVPAGYTLASAIEKYSEDPKNKLDLYRAGRERPSEHNLQLLMEGRLDVVGDEAQVVCYLAHSMGLLKSIEYAGNDGDHVKLYIAFSPADTRSARHAALFDEGIRSLRESGRLAAILDRYGLTDWQ